MRASARNVRAGRGNVLLEPFTHAKGKLVNSIIYIVGLVVVIGFVLGFFGLR